MKEESFVRYLNEPDIHDGVVKDVVHGGGHCSVFVRTAQGREIKFEFVDVSSVEMNRPEGMVLYSLSEMKEVPPNRKFVFTNWDEQNDARLEIVALDVISSDLERT
ncbi:MAG TPA: hypothetical protein VGC60_12380 [Pyrinomonadaceae bacterium]